MKIKDKKTNMLHCFVLCLCCICVVLCCVVLCCVVLCWVVDH